VIGIVANRLVEKYHRPAILLSTPDDKTARGSARSVAGIDISAAIAKQSGMLKSFGGHPMAAGLSLAVEDIDTFRQALSSTIRDSIGDEPPQPMLQIDGYVSLREISLEMLSNINRMAPFGPGNEYPTLVARDVEIRSYGLLGRQGNHLQIIISDSSGDEYRVLRWHGVGKPLPEDRFDLALLAKISTYRNRPEIQLEWIDAREDEIAQIDLTEQIPDLEIIDLRDSPDPLKTLTSMDADHPMIWVEGENGDAIEGSNRLDLETNETLIIWTIPPNQATLRKAIDRVSPQKIVLVARPVPNSKPRTFLTRLTGLVKYALKEHGGHTTALALAAATAQTKWAVLKGLEWLSEKGEIIFQHDQEGEIKIKKSVPDGQTEGRGEKSERIMREIEALLAETEAYRTYFRRADPDILLRDEGTYREHVDVQRTNN
jgi:single-stranded-DNA-specific exonuclease